MVRKKKYKVFYTLKSQKDHYEKIKTKKIKKYKKINVSLNRVKILK
jgi:hypothetical protein